MRGHTATQVLLLAVVLSQQLITVDTRGHKPVPSGMPLSEAEYKDFFRAMNNPQRRGMVCFLRETYGCQHPWIKDVDQYENHGLIPEGQVCSTQAEHPTFPDFCSLAMYRCTAKEYFVKRVLCPTEISKPSSDAEMIAQQVNLEHSTSSIQSLHSIVDSTPIAATAVSSTKSFFEWVASIFSTTATEVYSPTLPFSPEFHTTPTPVASTTNSVTSSAPASTRKPLLDLLLESTLKLLVPTAARTKIDSLMKQLTASEDVTAGETSHQLTTTTATTTTASLSQLHSYSATTISEEPAVEFSTTTAAATATTLPSTTTTTTTTTTNTATTTTPSSTPPPPTSTDATSSTPMQVRTSGATTAKSSSQLPSHSPFAAPSSITKTSANHLPMSATVSSLSTEATVIVSSSATSSQAQSGPAPSPSQKQSLQPNSNLSMFHFSTFLHPKPGDRLRLSPLLQMRARSPDAQQLKEIPQFPTSNLRDIFFQMQDRTAQQLMQYMYNMMAKGKTTQKGQLQATSLLVLRALNLANVQKKSKRSLRLQRKNNRSPF